VFVPRPVTEGLVRLALEAVAGRERPAVIDVGTGSGAVALAIAAACPEAEVHATDVSRAALRCARRNRRRLGLPNVRFHHGSLLESLPVALRGRATAIVANLPYVPMEGDVVENPLLPVGTFVGHGRDGLDLLRELARGASEFLEPGGWLAVQLASFQWKTFPSDLASMGYRPFPPDRIRPVGAAVGRARWIGGSG
jgi:release factor glutamine methyltransferase